MFIRMIAGISMAVLGALISVIPNFGYLQVCRHCHDIEMMAKVEFGFGVLIIFLSILLTFTESKDTRLVMSASLGLIGIFSALIAKVLIGFRDGNCSPDCSCSLCTVLCLMTLGILLFIIAFIYVFYLWRIKNT